MGEPACAKSELSGRLFGLGMGYSTGKNRLGANLKVQKSAKKRKKEFAGNNAQSANFPLLAGITGISIRLAATPKVCAGVVRAHLRCCG
jgi:hypothetical protein